MEEEDTVSIWVVNLMNFLSINSKYDEIINEKGDFIILFE